MFSAGRADGRRREAVGPRGRQCDAGGGAAGGADRTRRRRREIAMSETADALLTAGLLVVGDEILSGRTKDKNIGYIAEYLTAIGIDLREVRIVADEETAIVEALNALRPRYSYVFTTGGIGPTHDDITADAVGAAFGLAVEHHPEAMALLSARYRPGEFNERRQRMARVPKGASLIKNPVSVAPGFQIGNVFVL